MKLLFWWTMSFFLLQFGLLFSSVVIKICLFNTFMSFGASPPLILSNVLQLFVVGLLEDAPVILDF